MIKAKKGTRLILGGVVGANGDGIRVEFDDLATEKAEAQNIR